MTSVYFVYVGSVIFLHIYKSYRREQKLKAKRTIAQFLKSSELTKNENNTDEGFFDEESAGKPLLDSSGVALTDSNKSIDSEDNKKGYLNSCFDDGDSSSNFFSRTFNIVDKNFQRYYVLRQIYTLL